MSRAPLAVIALLALASCGPAAPAKSPAPADPAPNLTAAETLVRALYVGEAIPANSDALLAPDLAAALDRDGSHSDEVGAIDFDWRYDAQDMQISHLTFDSHTTPAGARIEARFDNFGKPGRVDYDLTRLAGGWRVIDVSAPAQNGDQAWSLRAMLGLAAR